jgi:hypothetical protein
MNYQLQGSNSNNYEVSPASPMPDSFALLMENGILIKYETIEFSTELVSEIVEVKKAI